MGIRGAFSLLSNDPRRFGTPWLMNNNEKSEDESSCVFLDGPSLLYHISIEGDVYDHSPPLTIAQIHRQGTAEQASPAKIHTRITNFLTALLQVCSGHVRVVMDGLAPEEKIPTQVDRLRVMAIQGDKHATKPKSPCKLLHLLAESAMVEAVYHVMEMQPRLFLHQPARGEAETFIDYWIKRHSPYDNIYIVSDDTDFLVYSSCPGFIPFKTLEFHLLGGRLSLNGFQYLRSKFMLAFFPDFQNEHVMTAVAALTGCDYGMSDSFKRARIKMIQSDFGGLRRRLRNDPTSAAALTAVLRYVSYWMKRKQDSWLSSMTDALCLDDAEKKELLVSLNRIHVIYFPSDTTQFSVDSDISVECRRLLECGVVYCRPLIETWETLNESASRPSPSSRKRARKSGKSRTRKRPIVHQDYLSRSLDAIDNPPRDVHVPVPFPPTQAFVDHCLSTGSAWSVFNLVRARLYSLIHRHFQGQQENRPILLHTSWKSQEPTITECIRVGRGEHVDFVRTCIPVLPCESTSISILDDILKCIVVTQDRVDVLKKSSSQEWQIIMTALMLPAKSAFLLILLCKAPWPSSQPSTEQEEKLLPPLRECMTLISVALSHSSLLRNLVGVCSADDMETQGSVTPAQGSAVVCRIFRDEVAIRIWAVMTWMNSFDDDLFQYGTSAGLVGEFFDRLRTSRTESLPWSESDVQVWHQHTSELWTIWCLASTKQN